MYIWSPMEHVTVFFYLICMENPLEIGVMWRYSGGLMDPNSSSITTPCTLRHVHKPLG